MNTPSVTGKYAQVPNLVFPPTEAEAFCNVSVSAATRHWKMELLMLPCGRAGGPKHPAADAKA